MLILTYDFWLRCLLVILVWWEKHVRMNRRTLDIIGVLEPVPDYPERIDVLVNTVSSPHHMSAAMVNVNHSPEHPVCLWPGGYRERNPNSHCDTFSP